MYITRIIRDRMSDAWVAAEDGALCRYDPSGSWGGRWARVAPGRNFPDDPVISLCCDKLGRIWAGHVRTGVSVFNGKTWRTYGPLDGPLGSHVAALCADQRTGDVWMGTEAGLCRYSPDGKWSYYTTVEGLASNQISAIACDARGNVLVGTECDGLSISNVASGYRHWRHVQGPIQAGNTPMGAGLPSALVNDILVTDSGFIFVATTCGIASSKDGGQSWRYRRGRDYADKSLGLLVPQEPQPVLMGQQLLQEDYCTCLAQDANGWLWIGHRNEELEAYDLRSGRKIYPAQQQHCDKDFVTAICPDTDGSLLVGSYGGGILKAAPFGWAAKPAWKPSAGAVAPEPTPANAPSGASLRKLALQVAALSARVHPGGGDFLGEDWQTGGDWVGRYGMGYAVLCAGHSPRDHEIMTDLSYRVSGQVGPHAAPNESLRHWIQWLQSDDPRVLWDPICGTRREGEWDDHSEEYPMSFDGVDDWITVDVPSGTHRISLYFMNKDGRDGANRWRDYLVELRAYRASLIEAEALPPLARGRVRNFWFGVYKSFEVMGPSKFYIKVAKNNSFNTIVNAVFVDRLAGGEGRTDGPLAWMGDVEYRPPASRVVPALSDAPELTDARALWLQLHSAHGWASAARVRTAYGILAYRAAAAAAGPPDLLDNWRWNLHFWQPQDRADFMRTMRAAYVSLLRNNPQMVGKEF